jgi:hypothetical protein
MLTAALAYAHRGIPVLPLHCPTGRTGCSCGRPGCDRPGKHPRLPHGLTEASTDPRRIDLWWSRWPDANIGLRTGIVMDVADVDTHAGGQALLHVMGGAAPVGPTVRTGGGGRHLWLRPTGYGNRVGVLPGVDWRGVGGYVVAPPSRHAHGTAYTWLCRSSRVPACPPALRDLVAGPGPTAGPDLTEPGRLVHPGRYAEVALDAETGRVAHAPVGTRNDTLNRAAFALGRLVGAGLLDEASVIRELSAAARYAGLGRVETGRTIRSGLTAGRRRVTRAA